MSMIRAISRHTMAAAIAAVMLIGCAQNAPYHDRDGSPDNCRTAPTDEHCSRAYYQEHPGFDLAFAEFTDRGNAFNDLFIDDVLQRIRTHAENEGVVLVTFVHGWKHNASEQDQNLIDFKKALGAVAQLLQRDFADTPLGSRRLIGLYVGWRGASITLPVVEQVTFWDRKAVAEVVGSGGVSRLLLELDELTGGRGREGNVMVVIGHSFGGAIVVSALNDVLTERVVNRTVRNRYAPTVGDGVIVLNPAIEANQALSFVEAAIREDYKQEQHPLFVSLSSDADSATHYAFPAGQMLGLLLTWRQADLARSYYIDREQPGQNQPLREEHLDTTTVGNFAPFLTHRIRVDQGPDAPEFDITACVQAPESCEPMGLTSLSGQPAIRTLPQGYPLFFYKTDDSMIGDHNDIFNDRVRAFIVTIIDDVVRRSLRKISAKITGQETTDVPSILQDSAVFERRLQTIYPAVAEDPAP